MHRVIQLTTITSVEELIPQLPVNGGYSTLDCYHALGEVAQLPADARIGIVASWTRHTGDGKAYLRVDALYLLTEVEGRLGIKLTALLAMTELS